MELHIRGRNRAKVVRETLLPKKRCKENNYDTIVRDEEKGLKGSDSTIEVWTFEMGNLAIQISGCETSSPLIYVRAHPKYNNA